MKEKISFTNFSADKGSPLLSINHAIAAISAVAILVILLLF
jgi:hypothetical protein